MTEDVDAVGAPPNEDHAPYAGPERRRTDGVMEGRFKEMQAQIDRRIAAVKQDVGGLRDDVAELRNEVADNTATTKRVEEGTLYVIKLIEAGNRLTRFFKFLGRVAAWILGRIRKLAVWLAPLLTIAGAIWAYLHGKPPGGL